MSTLAVAGAIAVGVAVGVVAYGLLTGEWHRAPFSGGLVGVLTAVAWTWKRRDS